MELTDILIFGFKDGVCVASAWKQSGTQGERFNRDTVAGWMKRGYEIRMVHKDDPEAKRHHDQMFAHAKAAADAARSARIAGQGIKDDAKDR